MRRSASEVIRNLESRIARLEKSSGGNVDKARMVRQLTPQLKDVIPNAKVLSTQDWETQETEEGINSTGTVLILESNAFLGFPFFMVVTQYNSWDGYLGSYEIYCITHDLKTAKLHAKNIVEKGSRSIG